ncbi:hypothetical protein ACLBXJ_28110 [Methylobacterium mesophilicum]
MTENGDLSRGSGTEKRQADISLVLNSGLFDYEWYLQSNEDVRLAGVDALDHFYTDGWKEGRNPSGYFHTQYYRSRYMSGAEAYENPLLHYIIAGKDAGYSCIPDDQWLFENDSDKVAEKKLVSESGIFSSEWYVAQYSNLSQSDELNRDPLLHFMVHGWKAGFNPGPEFDTNFYLNAYPDIAEAGVNPLVHYISAGRSEGRIPMIPARTIAEILRSRPVTLDAISVYPEQASPGRIFLITDSIGRHSLFGGVGTALIFSTLLASKLHRDLVIAVSDQCLDLSGYYDLLRAQNIKIENNKIEIVSYRSPSGYIGYGSQDIFITTAWWNTYQTLRSVPAKQIVYLVQEDESMFYSFNDNRLLCTEVMQRRDLTFVVNSRLLFDHFLRSDAFNVAKDVLWFEPAFSESSYYRDDKNLQKRQFMFYARPNNDRNLFYRGLEVIEKVLDRGIISMQEWEISFVGSNIPPIKLPGGFPVQIYNNIPWSEYIDIVRKIDLGLCLMYTPHPSYPPLDIVACGGVAVTNKFENKMSLERYSKNLICSDLHSDSLAEAITRGVKLSGDLNQRLNNLAAQEIQRNWGSAFADVIDDLVRRKNAA